MAEDGSSMDVPWWTLTPAETRQVSAALNRTPPGERVTDPRDVAHIECDCVPELGPSHCHLCSTRAGAEVPWAEAHPTLPSVEDVEDLAVELFERSHESSFSDDVRGMGEAREWAQQIVSRFAPATVKPSVEDVALVAQFAYAERAGRVAAAQYRPAPVAEGHPARTEAEVKAEAWDEGYRNGYRDRGREASYEPGTNPYRQKEADDA